MKYTYDQTGVFIGNEPDSVLSLEEDDLITVSFPTLLQCVFAPQIADKRLVDVYTDIYSPEDLSPNYLYGFRVKKLKTPTESKCFRMIIANQAFEIYKHWITDHVTIDAERKVMEGNNPIVSEDWMQKSREEIIPMPSGRTFTLHHVVIDHSKKPSDDTFKLPIEGKVFSDTRNPISFCKECGIVPVEKEGYVCGLCDFHREQ